MWGTPRGGSMCSRLRTARARDIRAAEVTNLAEDQTGRLQYAVIHVGRRRALHVVQIYGHADGSTKLADNERLVVAAMAWLRSLGDVPALP